ncbi:hypothetical protein F511_20045 [Dorcoceras hygrometricum]|uniref:Uncharacterized protein n=1 Tax=Dorcoceras hygrometricum TaxID=472368 RepID=A0A2Z7C8T1_9LAMI|nr:hypothetical protein F511_20045 [Dorcoceras hygrometricum]
MYSVATQLRTMRFSSEQVDQLRESRFSSGKAYQLSASPFNSSLEKIQIGDSFREKLTTDYEYEQLKAKTKQETSLNGNYTETSSGLKNIFQFRGYQNSDQILKRTYCKSISVVEVLRVLAACGLSYQVRAGAAIIKSSSEILPVQGKWGDFFPHIFLLPERTVAHGDPPKLVTQLRDTINQEKPTESTISARRVFRAERAPQRPPRLEPPLLLGQSASRTPLKGSKVRALEIYDDQKDLERIIQKIKFPVGDAVGEVVGYRKVVRKCYVEELLGGSLTQAHKPDPLVNLSLILIANFSGGSPTQAHKPDLLSTLKAQLSLVKPDQLGTTKLYLLNTKSPCLVAALSKYDQKVDHLGTMKPPLSSAAQVAKLLGADLIPSTACVLSKFGPFLEV